MSVVIQSRTYELIEKLVLGRITADNWADARLRQALYSAIGSKLAASDADSEQVSRYQTALTAVSANVEASAKIATSYEDFLDLKAAARAVTLSPESQPPALIAEAPSTSRLPHVNQQAPVAAALPETTHVRRSAVEEQVAPETGVENAAVEPMVVTGPPAITVGSSLTGSLPTPAKVDDRPVRTIPLWLIMAGVALLAIAYAFWPGNSGCSLRSTTCVTERVVTAGPGLTDQEARQLRVAIVNVQSTPTHVFARVRVQNTGTRSVHAISPNAFQLAFRLRPTAQAADALRLEQFNPNRIGLSQDIPPGTTIEVPLLATRPAGAAALALELSFVVEARFWAFQIGLEPLAVPVP